MSLIIVEGENDISFIKNYIKYLYNNIELNSINIIDAGGKDNIEKCKAYIERAIECDEPVLIIFDADANFQSSKENILEQLKELSLKKTIDEENIFLFPNNKEVGDLETLFCKISKYTDIFDCFDKYIDCIKKIKTTDNLQLPKNKDKIYAYLDCFGYKNIKHIKNHKYIFNLNSEYLEPLKNFFINRFRGKLEIRKSTIEDIDHIQNIYDHAREYMISQGNKNQWTNGYPDYDTIKTDIENNHSYVCIDKINGIVGTFVFYISDEEDYNEIEGNWINNDKYGVVHRIATNKNKKGVGSFCLRYCFERINNIKIDTHKDNIAMQKLLEKEGYAKCGIITLKRNGAKRIAFQKV